MSKSYRIIACSGDCAAGAMGSTAAIYKVPEIHFHTVREYIYAADLMEYVVQKNGFVPVEQLSQEDREVYERFKKARDAMKETEIFQIKYDWRSEWTWLEVPEADDPIWNDDEEEAA